MAYGGLVNAERCAPENETDEVIVNIPKMSQYLSCEKLHVCRAACGENSKLADGTLHTTGGSEASKK